MASLHVVALPGDGIGPEVTSAMIQVLSQVASVYGHDLTVEQHDVGWAAFEARGTPLPPETLDACRRGPAVFLGAVGDPRSDGLPPETRPEAALLRIRSELGCFANLRPARVDPALVHLSALRPELAGGVDLLVVRELTGGLYYGTPRGFDTDAGCAVNTLVYHEYEVERIARIAFDYARRRRRRVVSVDKANVLEVSQLWRRVVTQVSDEYADVTLEHMFVDRAAMELVTNPEQFDVVLTSNLFGDILSDEAAAVCGSLGLLASASIGGQVDLYEPVHGSAPDISGQGIADPIGAIMSGALMLANTFDLQQEAASIERAVHDVLSDGIRTPDLALAGQSSVTTGEFACSVTAAVR